jgi:hydroxyacylglutathione hydrolase
MENYSYFRKTHIHADFLAGSRELAALTGEMYLSAKADRLKYEFPSC